MSHANRSRRQPCVEPRVAEIRRAQAKHGLTNAAAADLVCVPLRTWENWVADEGNAEHRPMPKGAWKLFRYELGMLAPPKKTRL